MPGLRASRIDLDNERTLPHLLILAGLVTAFSLFLVISSRRDSAPPGNAALEANAIPARRPQPIVPEDSADVVPIRVVPEAMNPAVSPQPSGAKPRPKTFISEENIPEQKPAVAEKPSAPVASAVASYHPVSAGPAFSESELESALKAVPTVGLDRRQVRAVLEKIRSPAAPLSTPKRLDKPEEAVLAMLDRATAGSLPFAESSECRLERSEALALQNVSRLLHTKISLTEDSVRRRTRDPESSRDPAVIRVLKKTRNFQSLEAVPALVQILQVEPAPVREFLITMLAEHATPEATRGLVNRAVFDLSRDVRQSANTALAERYHSGHRRDVLEALRHPWPPVAWHAAETLAAVNDQEAVPELIELLDAPNPAKPHCDEAGNWVVRELVRIKHNQNCLLCHPTSQRTDDLVAKAVPDSREVRTWGRIPTVSLPGSRSPYSGGSSGVDDVLARVPNPRNKIRQSSEIFVRADVTYLRQDFSVMHGAERFDYLVRTREATPQETLDLDTIAGAEAIFNYPQRDAVLYALRKLTGETGTLSPKTVAALEN